MKKPFLSIPEPITTGYPDHLCATLRDASHTLHISCDRPDQGISNKRVGFVGSTPMQHATQETIAIVHNKVPSRIRFRTPVIKHKRTLAELLKHSLLKDPNAKGIYHAEPNVITGTLLVKYHPALHTEAEVVQLVRTITQKLIEGKIEISAKHKNPRIGKMVPRAFFTRELLVSICGNLIAGLILAALVAG